MSNYIFFWKPKDKNGYLSQWYPAEMYIGGLKYVNCEQYMMASKALLFNDTAIFNNKIMNETNPSKIKDVGREVKNFDESVWNKHKDRIIFEGNLAKFSQNVDLLKLLLNTGDSILAEASPYDRIYGIGMKEDNPNIKNTSKWGQNILGNAIMNVRDLLRFDERILRSFV